MGIIFNDPIKIKESIKNRFGENTTYLIVLKHNSPLKQGIKLLISNLYNTYDSNRSFILVFTEEGIFKKEISKSDKSDFKFIPINEIDNLNIIEKSSNAFLDFNYLDKSYSYKVPFSGKIFNDNKNYINKVREMYKM